ncbi:MAG: prolyl-tRNA synthetase [Candidatus Wildermuthbacteria bacterium]|nr:prolyl-tRNA synthetase [Candidatus Wildermuthbacteria bacterium]
MRQSQYFAKTKKESPKDEESTNAKLLIRAGFIHKEMAGVYTFLPLGLRVLNKIEQIIREEMINAGAHEMLMPSLHPKENWQITGRWESFDALFRLESRHGKEYALGPTHEEILYPLLKQYVESYKDLPVALFQIQTKFRDEARAKSGLMRGREFRMKDLYSFHATTEDRDRYYEVMRQAYIRSFKRLGLRAIETQASGGTFSELSAEFQVPCESGEDIINFCETCQSAVNEEVMKGNTCPTCSGKVEAMKAVEVGNIFPLKSKYSEDFNLIFKDKEGSEKFVEAGCYGIGTSRIMGTIAEISHDDKGLIWPANIAPFFVYLIQLPGGKEIADALHDDLEKQGIEVLYDDREYAGAGEKFADADLIGIPYRIVASAKTAQQNAIELKKRNEASQIMVPIAEAVRTVKDFYEKH